MKLKDAINRFLGFDQYTVRLLGRRHVMHMLLACEDAFKHQPAATFNSAEDNQLIVLVNAVVEHCTMVLAGERPGTVREFRHFYQFLRFACEHVEISEELYIWTSFSFKNFGHLIGMTWITALCGGGEGDKDVPKLDPILIALWTCGFITADEYEDVITHLNEREPALV